MTTQPADYAMFHDCASFAECTKLADELTAKHSIQFLPCDAGEWCFPRYGAIRAFKVGDKVSKSFNGDSYPEGEISKISSSYKRIQTTTGKVFWRRANSASWVNNSTWHLTMGHHYEQNPSF